MKLENNPVNPACPKPFVRGYVRYRHVLEMLHLEIARLIIENYQRLNRE